MDMKKLKMNNVRVSNHLSVSDVPMTTVKLLKKSGLFSSSWSMFSST